MKILNLLLSGLIVLFLSIWSPLFSKNDLITPGINSHNIRLENPFTLSGTVSDDTGVPLIGVNIHVKGTDQGTATDMDGKFFLENIEIGDVIVLSYVGYTTREITIENAEPLEIVLESNSALLDEVVVVGYGSQIKKAITGSVQTIGSKEFKDLPVAQMSQKLRGRLAGVQIKQTSGRPGAGMSIRIRGQLSVSGGSSPLYVVDGFPISGDIASINPDEIENISILKDAASTSLYGSRAANGVVMITTVKGRANETNIGVNSYYGFETVPMRGRLEMMDAYEFATFKKEYYEAEGQPVPSVFQNPEQFIGKNNDWYDALLRTSPIQSYNLTVTSNKDKVHTSVVAGVFSQDGVVVNTAYNRYSLRLNTNYEISDKVKLGFNIAPNYIVDNMPRTDGDRGTGIIFNAMHTWPVMPIYDENGELTYDNTFPAETGNIYTYPNWVRAANELVNKTNRLNVLGNTFLEYSPIDDLVLKSTFNVEVLDNRFLFFNPSTATNNINVSIPTTAVSIRENYRNFIWLNENTATYSKTLGPHSFEILGGLSNQKYRHDRTRVQSDTYADDRINAVQGGININKGGTNSGVEEWTLTSLLSRLTYDFNQKYLLTASIRGDGSSRFGAENRWGIFPSVSAGWVISDENFFTNINSLSFAKIRASYGVTGNNNIGNYTSYALINNTVNTVFNDNVRAGAAVSSLSNPNLGWETTKQFDIGLDLGILKDRIQFVYDYYNKTTTNLLYSVQVAQESGFGNFNDNIGEINFWGHEFSVNSFNFSGDFSWTTNANISFNRNKVIELADGIDRVYGRFHITQVGQPFGQFYGLNFDGFYMNQADLESSPQVPGRSTVGSIKMIDTNGDGIITYGGDEDDRTIIGNPFPKFTYGLVNDFRFKNWDASISIDGSQGNKLFARHLYSTANLDGVFNLVEKVKYRFRSPDNPGDGLFGTTVGGGNVTGIERDWVSSNWIFDASYLSIRNITLGYTIDNIQNIMKSARIYLSVQNAIMFTDYWAGQNPDVSSDGGLTGDGGNLSPGVDFIGYPIPRTISFGVNLNF